MRGENPRKKKIWKKRKKTGLPSKASAVDSKAGNRCGGLPGALG